MNVRPRRDAVHDVDVTGMADAVAGRVVPLVEAGIAEVRAAQGSVLDGENLAGERIECGPADR